MTILHGSAVVATLEKFILKFLKGENNSNKEIWLGHGDSGKPLLLTKLQCSLYHAHIGTMYVDNAFSLVFIDYVSYTQTSHMDDVKTFKVS